MNKGSGKSKRLDRLFTVSDGSLYYLVIPKCGCTYVKNILWHIEKGRPHENPKRIHDFDAEFKRASDVVATDEDVKRSDRAFVVLRNPVDRFLSLYFDKVVGPGWKQYVPLRRILAEHYGLEVSPQTVFEHRQNCARLVRFLSENLKDGRHIAREAHWTPQSDRRNIIEEFNLKVLLTENLTEQMNIMLHGMNPDLVRVTTEAERYSSGRDRLGRRVLDETTRKEINRLYASDRQMFKAAREAWGKLDGSLKTMKNIPRFSDLTNFGREADEAQM